jgi:hypothetical protein
MRQTETREIDKLAKKKPAIQALYDESVHCLAALVLTALVAASCTQQSQEAATEISPTETEATAQLHSTSATPPPEESPSSTAGPFPAAIRNDPYQPEIDPAEFTTKIDNPYFPLAPGTSYRFEGTTSYGHETDTVTVTNETVEILGVRCVVVKDAVQTNGQLTELTFDWYAQDGDGNVWYFGEDSHEISGGVATSSYGSWKAGVDGARPGVVMPADPKLGLTYRQEYLAGEAEDMARVLALNESATVPYGSFDELVLTQDWSPLEPTVIEHKYYAQGVGLVMETLVSGPDVSKLVSVQT